MAPRVKICGVTCVADALVAARAGAHALGLNFAAESPRYVGGRARAQALIAECGALPDVAWAGVFVNPPLHDLLSLAADLKLDIIQLHGEETPEYVGRLKRRLGTGVAVWKAFRVAAPGDLDEAKFYNCDAWLLDAKVAGVRGGSGRKFDWSILKDFARAKPVVLSGGLNPDNVAEAIRAVRPEWVDTASGVERAPGFKDAELVLKFLAACTG